MPRLINRAGTSAAPTTALPPYEPLSFPLNESARRELSNISEDRASAACKDHLSQSLEIFTTSIGDLLERLAEHKRTVERKRIAAQDRGQPLSQPDDRLKEHVARLEGQAKELASHSEGAVRQLIDQRYDLEDEATVVRDLYTQIATEAVTAETAAAPPTENVDASESTPDPTSVMKRFKQDRRTKQNEYSQMTVFQRYAQNNDYTNFKRVWHDAAVGDDGPPLPDKSRWFNSATDEPVLPMPRTPGAAGDMDMDNDDDEIAVAREILSYKCPLTLKPMEEPFSNSRCKHTFEKSAILEYLEDGKEKQCPETGCQAKFKKQTLDQDFFLDKPMMRRIQRAKVAQARMEEEEEEEQSQDEMDRSVAETGHRGVRGADARRMKRESMSAVRDRG